MIKNNGVVEAYQVYYVSFIFVRRLITLWF